MATVIITGDLGPLLAAPVDGWAPLRIDDVPWATRCAWCGASAEATHRQLLDDWKAEHRETCKGKET